MNSFYVEVNFRLLIKTEVCLKNRKYRYMAKTKIYISGIRFFFTTNDHNFPKDSGLYQDNTSRWTILLRNFSFVGILNIIKIFREKKMVKHTTLKGLHNATAWGSLQRGFTVMRGVCTFEFWHNHVTVHQTLVKLHHLLDSLGSWIWEKVRKLHETFNCQRNQSRILILPSTILELVLPTCALLCRAAASLLLLWKF